MKLMKIFDMQIKGQNPGFEKNKSLENHNVISDHQSSKNIAEHQGRKL